MSGDTKPRTFSDASNVVRSCLAAAVGGGIQIAIMNPIDCLRIRLQVCRPPTSLGTLSFGLFVVKRQGYLAALHSPGLAWNVAAVAVSQGVRLGLYQPVRDIISSNSPKQQRGAPQMMLAGLVTGSLAYALACPLYLLKTRAQAMPQYLLEGRSLPKYEYNSLRTLWTGVGPLVIRGATLTMGQTLCYDLALDVVKTHQLVEDGPFLVVLRSVAAGFGAATFSAPADVIMARYMANGATATIPGTCVELFRESGLRSFGRGWTANMLRYVPTYIIGLSIMEQIRVAFGLGYSK